MGRIEYKLLGYANTSKRVFCDECGLHYIMKNVERYTVYTFWAVAYNVHQGYESGASEKVRIDTASYGMGKYFIKLSNKPLCLSATSLKRIRQEMHVSFEKPVFSMKLNLFFLNVVVN